MIAPTRLAVMASALLLLLSPVLAEDKPLELVGIDYRLYYWPQNATQAQTAAQAAQAGIPRLRQALGLKSSERVDLHVAPSAAEFRRLTGGSDPDRVLGQAFPQRRLIVLQPLKDDFMRRLVVHELTHVLLEDKVAETGAQPPRWLHEGLAKYAADDFTPTDRMLLTDAVNSGKLVPLENLDKAFAGSPEKQSLAYAESQTAVEFLANLEPDQGLAPFLMHLGQVGDVDRALLRAYNLTPEAFATQWRRHMLREYLGRSNEDLGTFAIWGGIVVVFLALVVIQRRRAAVIRRRLEQEEQARERATMWSLPGRQWWDEGEAGGSPGEPEEDNNGHLH